MTDQAKRMMSGRRRWVLIGLLVAVAVYLLFFAPARTYIDQRAQMAAAEQRYELLAQTNEDLRHQVDALQSDEEIERLARQRYELVSPGQQAWAVMEPPAVETEAVEKEQPPSLWDRLWIFD